MEDILAVRKECKRVNLTGQYLEKNVAIIRDVSSLILIAATVKTNGEEVLLTFAANYDFGKAQKIKKSVKGTEGPETEND